MDHLKKIARFFKKLPSFLFFTSNFNTLSVSWRSIFYSIVFGFAFFLFSFSLYLFLVLRDLPQISQLKNYKPALISSVFDRNGEKIGEFFKERRKLTPFKEFPDLLVQAFVAAEDGRFFEHKGLNYQAIFRAFWMNLKKGGKVQGGSTITQQVARALLLSSEKTYTRKLKEAILSLRIEQALTKQEILYLYLNQIYLGQGAYGVGMAAQVYFRKKVKNLNLAECALLAGLPKAPSKFSPIYNAHKSKSRQLYVLQRMNKEGYISSDQLLTTVKKPVKVYREKRNLRFPYYMETLRQALVSRVSEEALLTKGFDVHTSMDHSIQALAQKFLKTGLKKLDKRQGFRGALNVLKSPEDIKDFLKKEEDQILKKEKQIVWILPENKNLPSPLPSDLEILEILSRQKFLKGVVQEVNDSLGQVFVELAFGKWGVIPLKNMKWARPPNPKISFKNAFISKPSQALKAGDVILVQIEEKLYSQPVQFKLLKKSSKTLMELSLDQKPVVEGALIAFDQKTEDIVALVGGRDFNKSQFNRAYQANRQTGSVFKPVVYLAALERGFTGADVITDAPVVYNQNQAEEQNKKSPASLENVLDPTSSDSDSDSDLYPSHWKPFNYSHRFAGDILFRNALIRSMNVPTVKLIETLGIQWVVDYSRRLGLFHPLNRDYTLSLGSSSLSLYEMTKFFSILGRLGKKIQPTILQNVQLNQELILGPLSLDERFPDLLKLNQQFKQKREEFLKNHNFASSSCVRGAVKDCNFESLIFFKNPDQLLSPQTAFIMTHLLNAVIYESGGTGYRARSLGRPAGGKTGTTNGYYDAWFIGYTPNFIAGVWVGFDYEQSLGIGETGARAALPIWLNFMKAIHKDLEVEDFEVPPKIVFTNIDNKTGRLVTDQSSVVVNQAFVEGSEPLSEEDRLKLPGPMQAPMPDQLQDQNFLREDLSQ